MQPGCPVQFSLRLGAEPTQRPGERGRGPQMVAEVQGHWVQMCLALESSLVNVLWLPLPFLNTFLSMSGSGSLLRLPGENRVLTTPIVEQLPSLKPFHQPVPSCTSCPLALCLPELFSPVAPPQSSQISRTFTTITS